MSIQCGAFAGALSITGLARATPVPLPFTYPYETLSKGEAEDELYGDMSLTRVNADPADPTKGQLWEPAYVLQNEIEYGVSDHLELAWYQVFEANPVDGGGNVAQFDGFKFRARLRLAEAGRCSRPTLWTEAETSRSSTASSSERACDWPRQESCPWTWRSTSNSRRSTTS
jgi:hypothetical protein